MLSLFKLPRGYFPAFFKMLCYVVPVGGRYSVCENGHPDTGCPRVLEKECRGWGGGRVGRLAGVNRNASRRAGRAGREAHAGSHTDGVSCVLGWEHVDEICDVIPGGLAGRLLRLGFGFLRLRGGIDGGCPVIDLLLSDGHDYDDGDVSYLLHVRVPDVHRLHGVGKENRHARKSVRLALPP